MRSRLGLLILACYLTFAVVACTSKPPANDANSATTTDSNNPNNPAANGGAATADNGSATSSAKGSGKGGAMASGKEAAGAPAPIVIPAGTVLTVRLAETQLEGEPSRSGFSPRLRSQSKPTQTVIPAAQLPAER